MPRGASTTCIASHVETENSYEIPYFPTFPLAIHTSCEREDKGMFSKFIIFHCSSRWLWVAVGTINQSDKWEGQERWNMVIVALVLFFLQQGRIPSDYSENAIVSVVGFVQIFQLCKPYTLHYNRAARVEILHEARVSSGWIISLWNSTTWAYWTLLVNLDSSILELNCYS